MGVSGLRFVEGNRYEENSLRTVRLGIIDSHIESVVVYHDIARDLPTLMPGFVDIHIHGGGGADTMDATAKAFATIAKTHARYGTTSLLLTTVTESPDRIEQVLREVKSYRKEQDEHAATVEGVHLEGPFIHPQKAGAQRRDRIIDPDPDLAKAWFSSGVVKMITLAPDRPHAKDVAKMAADSGILVSVGHTNANVPDLLAAKESGFSHVTHLCNAMPSIHHREVGPIGFVMEDDQFTADLICDGIHVNERMMRILIRSIGTERLMLITDAIRACGVGSGIYDLGGLTVEVADGACRLQDGTLAGSILTMADAVKSVQSLGRVSSYASAMMASYNPAKRIGLLRKGKIETGYDADIVALDAAGSTLWTMIQGKMAFEA